MTDSTDLYRSVRGGDPYILFAIFTIKNFFIQNFLILDKLLSFDKNNTSQKHNK